VYSGYDGFKPFSDFYQYFVPLSYRLQVIGANNNTAGFNYPIAFGFFPVNYIVEATPTFTSVDAATLSEMQGTVMY
jgi:hypothetical protein